MVPDLYSPIGGTGQKDLGMKAVPLHRIDGHVMRVERVQELIGVRLRALVNAAFLGAHQKDLVLVLVEVKACATAERGDHTDRTTTVRGTLHLTAC